MQSSICNLLYICPPIVTLDAILPSQARSSSPPSLFKVDGCHPWYTNSIYMGSMNKFGFFNGINVRWPRFDMYTVGAYFKTRTACANVKCNTLFQGSLVSGIQIEYQISFLFQGKKPTSKLDSTNQSTLKRYTLCYQKRFKITPLYI